ncbi:MAG: crossover junction endodeoxyribonuclease RuvC [Acidimicrobiia bacterium]
MFDSAVLGVDPGLSRCGFAVAERGTNRPVCRSAGVIRTHPDEALPMRLLELESQLGQLCDEFTPGRIAIERVLFQANARTAMAVGQASGIAMLVAARRGIPVVMFSPNEVKLALTGDGCADKQQIQAMLPRVFDLAEPIRQADAADALALAFCGLHGGGTHLSRTGTASTASPRLAAAIAAAVRSSS